MESRLSLDKEIDIPLSLIDPAPWNAKTPVHGVYRKGLKHSLDYFGMRDRLKVTPNPGRKGRYICLNGNQRIDVISEHFLDQKIRDHYKLEDNCPDSIFKQTKDAPENQEVIARLRKSLVAFPIPCQVMTRLNEETPLDASNAKLFTLTFDRNPAKIDEVKQADVYREIRAEQISSISEESRKAFDARLKSMVRPELPVVEPRSDAHRSSDVSAGFAFADPGTFVPTESEPWGPVPPPSPGNSTSGSAPVQFVPLVFSLTAEGYRNITSSCLRSRARLFREVTLGRSLEKLEQVIDLSKLDDTIDSVVVETALSILNKHIDSLEQESKDEPSSS